MRVRGGRFAERLRALWRVTAVRLSAIYLLLFAVFAVVLVFYVTATASGVLESQSRETITQEITELGRVYGQTGIYGLVRSIDLRSRQPGASLYLVTDATGRIVAGNVVSLDAGVLDTIGFTPRTFNYERYADSGVDPSKDRFHLALAQVEALPNGMRVLVGRDQTDQVRFRGIVRNALILALALMGVGALFAWFLVGRQALRRLDAMSASSNRILAGDLSERLPVTGAGDEFDRLSENLNRLIGRVALLQEGLRQVSDNIAHDLKTPLTRLRNRAEAALAGDGVDPRSALEGMIAEADGMIRTFDALLMIARVEAGSHPVMMMRANLSQLAADIAELYEPLAEEVGAQLVLEAPAPVMATVSRELISQAISNLVDNALKYAEMPDGRTTRIVIRVLQPEPGRCVIEVADNGPGIPADKRGRVLERFFRLDASRTKPGSGLGLSLVQAIARIHGGTIALGDAEPGLTVRLELPTDGRPGEDGDDG
ncbi:sensor histidine kinase [Antarcticirhabdus aurantiaca]|uniref:HAMP domain-containing sensor histidine kinase n=1 Tax=Antarcticirhabdus aurantiaca TaxID=2606717 RepID=A0ACD4NIR1_9HYPH|nr:HAMP domain-containing sensor histidine kinase [Antarcticirhabdus aurantiaca]WAJ26678.1 HAMP domain-containing sensor histidine kinase [Jeongeuplla avenae]